MLTADLYCREHSRISCQIPREKIQKLMQNQSVFEIFDLAFLVACKRALMFPGLLGVDRNTF